MSPLFKSEIQPSRSSVPVCAIAHIQKPMFFSSFSPFKLNFPQPFFGDELAPTVALQSSLIFYNTLENERENDMEINHIFLLDQNHSLSLSCSLPWVNYSLRTAIDLSSNRKFSEYLCKDCNWQDVSFNRKMPTFPHKLIINSIVAQRPQPVRKVSVDICTCQVAHTWTHHLFLTRAH